MSDGISILYDVLPLGKVLQGYLVSGGYVLRYVDALASDGNLFARLQSSDSNGHIVSRVDTQIRGLHVSQMVG